MWMVSTYLTTSGKLWDMEYQWKSVSYSHIIHPAWCAWWMSLHSGCWFSIHGYNKIHNNNNNNNNKIIYNIIEVGQISVLFFIFCNFFNFTKATKCLLEKTQLKLKYTFFLFSNSFSKILQNSKNSPPNFYFLFFKIH